MVVMVEWGRVGRGSSGGGGWSSDGDGRGNGGVIVKG